MRKTEGMYAASFVLFRGFKNRTTWNNQVVQNSKFKEIHPWKNVFFFTYRKQHDFGLYVLIFEALRPGSASVLIF